MRGARNFMAPAHAFMHSCLEAASDSSFEAHHDARRRYTRIAEQSGSAIAPLKAEGLVTRIAVLSTRLGQERKIERLMIGMSVETHKTSPDFDQKKCDLAKSRILQALGDIDCDVFIEMDR